MSTPEFDSILFLSFGGPEQEADVMPFLRTVTAGRNVPEDRLVDVAQHYLERDGRSPINDQNRNIIARLENELQSRNIDLPVYWGNRNWHPFLDEAFDKMRADGRSSCLAFVTSAYSSYSGCRQYREDISGSLAKTDAHIEVRKLRQFFNHPGFVEPLASGVRQGFEHLGGPTHVLFSAHSIPQSMARNCRYEAQLEEAARLVAQACSAPSWDVVYQSRSGRPQDPWLEPDINDRLRELASAEHPKTVVVCPLGFVSDHMEVVHDLDDEAHETAKELGIQLYRSPSPGNDPRFIAMIADLIEEQVCGTSPSALGQMGPVTCQGDQCCLSRARS